MPHPPRIGKESVQVLFELAFPLGHPSVERQVQVARRAEQMHVVGHENVRSGQPGVGFEPGLAQDSVDRRLREPRDALSRVDSEKDDGRLVQIDPYTSVPVIL